MSAYASSGGGGIIVNTTTITGGADGDILYNNGGVVGGFQLYDDTAGGDGAFALRKTMSGGSATSNFSSVTGTLPAVLTAFANAVSYQITGAGSSGFPIAGLKVDVLAGYTGISGGGAILASNATVGSATGQGTPFKASAFSGAVDLAVIGVGGATLANSNTAQAKVGVYGLADNGGRAYGVAGEALGSANFSVGGAFRAVNIAAASMGLYAALTGAGAHTPTFPATSAVLLLDNTNQAADIFVARANGTATFTIASAGAISTTAKIVQYNGVATAGWGVPAIQASGRSTAQAAAVASVATYTVGAADGSFIIDANVLVTTATTHNFTVTCAYTDEGNTARTVTLNFSSLAGVLAAAIINTGGAVPYEGVSLHIRCKAATAITIATTGTFTTVVYNVEASIRQIS